MTVLDYVTSNLADTISAGVILVFALQGLIRGLARELPRLLTVLISLAIGMIFHHPLSLFLTVHSRMSEEQTSAVAFATLVVGSLLSITVARILVSALVEFKVEIRGKRIGGLLAGSLSALAVVFMVFHTFNLLPEEAPSRQFVSESRIGSALVRFAPTLQAQAERLTPAMENLVPATNDLAAGEAIQTEPPVLQDDPE